MAESLAVVLALNTMIPLCSLLAFRASVSQSSWAVKVVSKTFLLSLTALAWLSQPVSKIQNIVSHLGVMTGTALTVVYFFKQMKLRS